MQKDDSSTCDSSTVLTMAPLNASTSAISTLIDLMPPTKAMSSNVSSNSLPSMDSDFGAGPTGTIPHVLNARIEDLKASEVEAKLNGIESSSNSMSNSACSSRKTSAVSEPEHDSKVETPVSETEVDKSLSESKPERSRKLSRFLVSPVVLPDNTVTERLPEVQEAKPTLPVEVPVQTQTIQSQIHPEQIVQPQVPHEYVPQYTPLESQTGETQQVMVPDPKWQQDQQHALISQKLEQAMGITSSSSVPIVAPQVPEPVRIQPIPLMPEQLYEPVPVQEYEQRDLIDSSTGMPPSKLPETLEQLQKELENITHAHVQPKKDSAPMAPDSDESIPVEEEPPRDSEPLQQLIPSYENTSSLSEMTNINTCTSSGGPLSRDDTSVTTSRRTSADMINIDIAAAQLLHDMEHDSKMSHQSSSDKSDR